ncbi:MAG: tRNA (N(6)-L-threonylcarbamoyladenosine(37)-C(2))-methylthiotransferase MtaB [Bacteroidaceae bacterium]|nr:tRNA (N(6)-L-threonylcarbamoyladenosine(37)-C(2))-methylthiotransferase MtaB [Bacteroidaceae bacterium]
MNTLKGKKAVFCTLGCKLNFAETSTIQQQIEAAGAVIAHNGIDADICIVNTCSVTEVAESKCRQAISKLRRKNPGAMIVVTGCYAQLRPERVAALEGVDLVVGTKQKGDIINLIQNFSNAKETASCIEKHKNEPFFPACACGDRTRFFLKVQDGCDYFCTYCTIPFARGRSRNGSIASLVKQAEDVVRQGGKEIILTGVNIGDFGRTTGEKFIDLIRALDDIEGVQRYRISSIEPNLLTEEVIRFCSQSRAFMPHFHIPLQSGSDEVLRLMHRRYDTTFFSEKIAEVRHYIPDAFIGVDVIAGMRGETDDMFANALSFMESLPVSQYHVFSYSERPGTKALNIPTVVSPEKKHQRTQQIINLSNNKLHTYYNIYIGQTRPVLLEKSSISCQNHRIMSGFTDNYIRVDVSLPIESEQMKANDIVQVRLGDWNESKDALIGEIIY